MAADPSIVRFRGVVEVAYRHLESRREEINSLNVFPVADGDTGDNMALTMHAVLEELDSMEREALTDPAREEIVSAVARAALMGARGNSGVILSQIVRGAAEELASRPGKLVDPVLVSAAFSAAERAAYASVRDPAEGTMLTAVREMAAAVAQRLAHWDSAQLDPDSEDEVQNALLADMLATALSAGEEAVRHTPEQLDVLAEAGVVDAGAHGLAIIVRGIIAGLMGDDEGLPEMPRYAPARFGDVHHEDSSAFRYCTNFMVTGEGLSARALVPRLEELGDSVLVVGDERTLKVHLHTDDPDAAMALFARTGTVERPDVADMHEQVAARRAEDGAPEAQRSVPAARCGFVAVACGDGLVRRFEELGVTVVDGGSTMNPSTREILEGIERAGTEEVVVFPDSPNVVMAAEEAARIASVEARVVACHSPAAALEALVEADVEAGAEQNRQRFDEVLAGVLTGAVAPAARDDAEGRFLTGDAVGFVGDELVAWGGAGSTLAAVLKRLTRDVELVSVYSGDGAPIGNDGLPVEVDGDVDVQVSEGGQPSYWWLIAAQ